ncbi:MAG: LLM class F420-dependent oxidoreductase, partial [Rickettsiales bacterium]|nr:LLM class F420-dependent oxidoreductase [Rickettsiales bacterium]
MKTGVVIRIMGTQSTRDIIAGYASVAEEMCFDTFWFVDHIAIPPDYAEGSGERYLDVLATLAWLAGITERVKLGS